ncbi:MAG: ATP-binding protein [Bacteroidetes bacterium]|nr:ATP-binding protein [Bacteroidota bacterium]
MITFTRDMAIDVVKKALHSVADFNNSADVTKFSFKNFQDYHKNTFMVSLKKEILNIRGSDYYFDVPLNPDNINNWSTTNDCINYLFQYTSRFPGKFQESENIGKNKIVSTEELKRKSKINLMDLINEGENFHIEFKSSLRWDYKEAKMNKSLEFEVIRSVAAFLNSEGGYLLIGVDDNKKILGLEKDFSTLQKNSCDGFQLHFNNLLNTQFGKNIHQFIRIYFNPIDGKTVCLVKILKSTIPQFLKKEKELFTIRINGASQNLNTKEAVEYAVTHWRPKVIINSQNKNIYLRLK